MGRGCGGTEFAGLCDRSPRVDWFHLRTPKNGARPLVSRENFHFRGGVPTPAVRVFQFLAGGQVRGECTPSWVGATTKDNSDIRGGISAERGEPSPTPNRKAAD